MVVVTFADSAANSGGGGGGNDVNNVNGASVVNLGGVDDVADDVPVLLS